MIFDKIDINNQSIEADGQFSINDEVVKITTISEEVGQWLTQFDTTKDTIDSIVLYKGEKDRFAASSLKVSHLTVVGGNIKATLEK